MRVLGIDLAWTESTAAKRANEAGVVAVDDDGNVWAAGWVCGLDETIGWMETNRSSDTLAMTGQNGWADDCGHRRLAADVSWMCHEDVASTARRMDHVGLGRVRLSSATRRDFAFEGCREKRTFSDISSLR